MKETKICKKCGRELPLSEFYKSKTNKDGHMNVCKECFSQQIKHYYQDNRDTIIEHQKQYKKEHKEEILEYQKQYRQDNKEYYTEYQKQYYQENKEKILEQQKQYSKGHKEEKAEYDKQYRQTPMGRAKNLLKAYRQNDNKYNRGECTLTAEWIVENIFSQPCHYCGETDWHKLGCDRIDNSLPHTPDNVNPCCEECNKKRGTKTYEEFLLEVDISH